MKAPTLFIIGGNDDKEYLMLTTKSIKSTCQCSKKEDYNSPWSNTSFEESGALEEVARLASGWFRCYFKIKEHSNRSIN